MDKEMEQRLQQMMGLLLAEIQPGQGAMKADINAKIQAGQEDMKARRDKADAEAKARHDQLKQDIRGHMRGPSGRIEVLWKRDDTCQVSSVACPEKSKASLKETEVGVVTIEGSLDRTEATGLEANPKETGPLWSGKNPGK
jgi:hypothetical protein